MKSKWKGYLAIGIMAIFLGATSGLLSSCAAKKKCYPPCPTWNKKKKH